MRRDPDTAQAADQAAAEAGEGAPQGAPDPSIPAPDPSIPAPDPSIPAGEPEAPVTPVSSVKSEAVGAPQSPGQPSHRQQSDAPQSPGPPSTGPEAAGAEADTTTPDVAPEADHERQLEHDLELLTAKAEKADEYLELAQRTRADFENYRKRASREAAAAQERGVTKLAKELLPAVDNLDRALAAAQTAIGNETDGRQAEENGTATLVSGIKLVHEDVIAALARAGIERFSPEGEPFDPQLHEAVAQLPVEGAESGTVVEVYQRGYRLGEVVIRPARVVVAA